MGYVRLGFPKWWFEDWGRGRKRLKADTGNQGFHDGLATEDCEGHYVSLQVYNTCKLAIQLSIFRVLYPVIDTAMHGQVLETARVLIEIPF